MFYQFVLTVPAGTAEDDALELDMKVAAGVVYRVSVGFPPGCSGLVHVVIDRFKHQVWPSSMGTSFAGDGFTVEFAEEYEMRERPHKLILRAWNEDELYSHTVTCRLGVRRYVRAVLGQVARRLWTGR